ncbi:MAG: hypothetical protein ABFS12_05725 [Bacteroidota bacterium]
MKKIILVSLIIGSFVLFHSCGASHNIVEEVVYKDNRFTFEQLMKKEVVIGGIASQQLHIPDHERIQYGTLLSTIIIEELKDVHNINIITTSQFIQRLGNENYINIMKEVDAEQVLMDEALDFITEEMPDFDYIITANIENENVIESSDSELVMDEYGEEEYETDYQRAYYLTVEFQVYDLKMKTMVWDIRLYNAAYRTETRTTETGCVESCISGTINDILFGSPAEIDREEVLAEIFIKFTEKLAEQ